MDERDNPTTQAYLEKQRARQREYYAAHKDEIRARINAKRKGKPRPAYDPQKRKEWYERNKERLREKRREWEAANPEKVKYYASNAYKRHRAERVQKARDYRGLDPKVLEARERREFFRGRPWLRNLFWKYRAMLPWETFKTLYERILNGPCDICGKTGEKMRIDHCHKEMRFRGLLCHGCNVSLGHFNDDPKLLRKAANYLEGNREAA